jgi:hypothetical protein
MGSPVVVEEMQFEGESADVLRKYAERGHESVFATFNVNFDERGPVHLMQVTGR